MDVVPRRILEVVSGLSEAERQWVGIRGVASRVPCGISVAFYRIGQLELEGFLQVERRGTHPCGITLTEKANELLAESSQPVLSGQIADVI